MLSDKSAQETGDRYAPSLRIMVGMWTSDLTKDPPDLHISDYQDPIAFYDPSHNAINMCPFQVNRNFECEDEAELLSAEKFVLQHEVQHMRSTANRPYALAVKNAVHGMVEAIQKKVDGTVKHFRSDGQYEDYVRRYLPTKNIFIRFEDLQRIAAGICNRLEDGRIERIRAGRNPGFKQMRTYFRGKGWESSDGKFPTYDEVKDDPAQKLTVIMNQILTLATCQLYEKGFAAAYAGTPIVDEVNALMDPIGTAITSKRTRGLIAPAKEIGEALGPLVMDAVKMSESDVAAQRAMSVLIGKMIEIAMDDPSMFDQTEDKEDTEGEDEKNNVSCFPVSDLVVTLPDDVYDKLVEKSKKTEGSEGGIRIRREHPKGEEKDKKEENNGTPSDEDGKGQNGSAEGQKTSEKEEAASTGGEEQGNDAQPAAFGDENGESALGPNEKDIDHGSPVTERGASDGQENGPDETDQEGQEPSGKDGSQPDSSGTRGDKAEASKDAGLSSGGEGNTGKAARKNESGPSGSGKDGDLDEIKAAMKEAAEKTRSEALNSIANVNRQTAHSKRTQPGVHADTSKALATEDVSKVIPEGRSFKELKRAYRVADHLPAVLEARGKTLHRKIERYFRSLKSPNITFLDSGSIDPSRIFGLAMGDTQIFRKKGKDKAFDGVAYVLLDNSGSMSGAKRMEASKAAAVIEEGFKGLVPLKIVAFDEYDETIHEVIKGFDEVQQQNCCWNFALHGREGAGNDDGIDIAVATKELLERPEHRKLLIVLSDGTPASDSLLRKSVKNARAAGITVHGIYFENGEIDGVPDWFAANYLNKDCHAVPLKDLDEVLLKLMKDFALKN